MPRLKSKTGCMTCLARKKKCDEKRPVCSHCERLGLACVRRDAASDSHSEMLVSSTNLKARGPPLQHAITNGYPSFRSDFERQVTLESSTVLRPLVSRMAGTWYQEETMFGRFCTQNRLVREAIVAFSAYGQDARNDGSYKMSLQNYQSCIMRLKQTRAYEHQDPAERDSTITAIVFLGLLEALKLGDPVNAVNHFEMCRKLLMARLSQAATVADIGLLNLYRMIAECIIYNLGTLSPFRADIVQAAGDWGTAFDQLFPGNDHYLSPFLGGFQGIYQVTFRISVLLRQTEADRMAGVVQQSTFETFDMLWRQLADLEYKIPTMYCRNGLPEDTIKLYQAKNKIIVYALRIHLTKIIRPAAGPEDVEIYLNLTQAIAILKEQDVQEPGNPALRWPLSILLCAADADEDFEFIVSVMQQMQCILDPANSRKLAAAYNILRDYRRDAALALQGGSLPTPLRQLDFLLEPRNLEEPGFGDGIQGRVLELT
ncbi:hypothetical protein DOTSEDRAFT_73439 [Dothistroma septosporum NZE10]|uniref:Zn(2)-C6 fungal-type domain-containing protein n=1 Tax=Dothistroma septosporum (strain NZE10 / CBS 128990) TaxID=675120 RepID=N1PJ32_DOTSN|nr:hypothetical protein DOTSEDRAFT_73439 [Dothistroma septosporum NZE10]